MIWFVAMRYKERHDRVPMLEPLVQQWRTRRSPRAEAEAEAAHSPLESTEAKSEGSGANLRVNEVSS